MHFKCIEYFAFSIKLHMADVELIEPKTLSLGPEDVREKVLPTKEGWQPVVFVGQDWPCMFS